MFLLYLLGRGATLFTAKGMRILYLIAILGAAFVGALVGSGEFSRELGHLMRSFEYAERAKVNPDRFGMFPIQDNGVFCDKFTPPKSFNFYHADPHRQFVGKYASHLPDYWEQPKGLPKSFKTPVGKLRTYKVDVLVVTKSKILAKDKLEEDFVYSIKDVFPDDVNVAYLNLVEGWSFGTSFYQNYLQPQRPSDATEWRNALRKSRKACGYKAESYWPAGEVIVRATTDKGDKWYVAHGFDMLDRQSINWVKQEYIDAHAPSMPILQEQLKFDKAMKEIEKAWEIPKDVEDHYDTLVEKRGGHHIASSYDVYAIALEHGAILHSPDFKNVKIYGRDPDAEWVLVINNIIETMAEMMTLVPKALGLIKTQKSEAIEWMKNNSN